MQNERVSCPCDYRIQNLVRVNLPKIGGQKMNREDIIRMAREAGLSGLMEGGLIDYFERFAALVAAAEREACAKVADDYAGNQQAWSCGLDSPEEYRMQAGHECADAIRARGRNEIYMLDSGAQI
jgi:hypothetical protein